MRAEVLSERDLVRGLPSESVSGEVVWQFGILMEMLDREVASRELVGVALELWWECASSAVAHRDVAVLHGLLDVLVSTARRRFGAEAAAISNVYSVAFERCVNAVSLALEKVDTVVELRSCTPLVVPLMSAWLGLLMAAHDGADAVRQRQLSKMLRSFALAPGGVAEGQADYELFMNREFYRVSGDPSTKEASLVSWCRVRLARWCADARQAIVAAAFAHAAQSLTNAPRREFNGLPAIGPKTLDDLKAFSEPMLTLAGGLSGLLRGYAVLARLRPDRSPLAEVLHRRWERSVDGLLSRALPDGFILAAMFDASVDPTIWCWGRLLSEPDLARIVGGGGPVALPAHAHEWAATLEGDWPGWTEILPADAAARARSLRSQLVSGPNAFHPPLSSQP